MKTTEAKLQIACMNYAAMQYPNLLIWHCPNGGSRNVIEAANLKRQGVKSGVCDIHVDKACGGFHGLKIELKSAEGKLSPAQADYLERVRDEGYATAVCYDFDDFVNVLNNYLTTRTKAKGKGNGKQDTKKKLPKKRLAKTIFVGLSRG
jgi:hypothetical protein